MMLQIQKCGTEKRPGRGCCCYSLWLMLLKSVGLVQESLSVHGNENWVTNHNKCIHAVLSPHNVPFSLSDLGFYGFGCMLCASSQPPKIVLHPCYRYQNEPTGLIPFINLHRPFNTLNCGNKLIKRRPRWSQIAKFATVWEVWGRLSELKIRSVTH